MSFWLKSSHLEAKLSPKLDGFVIFLDRAVPGQTVKARITEEKAKLRGGESN